MLKTCTLSFCFVVTFILGVLPGVCAQNVNISEGGTRFVCGGTFFDAGGPDGNHSASGQFQQITLCSDGVQGNGTHIQLTFTRYDINGDFVVFNGQDTNADTLWSNVTDVVFAESFRIPAATDANTSGCITIRFQSQGSGAGWAANINCVASCKPIIARLESTTPAVNPPGPDGYIDVCTGTPITFTATGGYPESGGNYVQEDATSLFFWNFQDGTLDTGRTVTHAYDTPGGYIVEVIIEDQLGCRNVNRISQRVRVAPPPLFNNIENLNNTICAGEEVSLSIGTGGSGINISPEPQTLSFTTSQTLSEITPLPDGFGEQYESPIIFTSFTPGQTLTDASDIVSICTSIEHSYLGDLEIRLQCPDGQQVNLHRYDPDNRVNGQLLGMGDPTTTTPDPPADYCWTTTSPETITQAVESRNIENDQTLPPGNYRPDGDLNQLSGCELNGEWRLIVIDSIPRDQGFIYSWGITFSEDIYPIQETFTVPLANVSIQDNGLFSTYTPENVRWTIPHPGPHTIRVATEDAYGCQYDTAIVLNVLPVFSPDCQQPAPILPFSALDTSICARESFQANLPLPTEIDTFIRWESVPNAPFGNALYQNVSTALQNDLIVTDHLPASITDVRQDIRSVCVDLDNNGDLSEVTLQLISPNGRLLTLLQNQGNPGDDLQQTCFTPTATAPLSGSSPYTGDFTLARGNWGDLNNAPINGRWRLRAWDSNGNDLGQLLRWSIEFNYAAPLRYSWTPANGTLSCTDCPNPVFTPDNTTTYTLSATTTSGYTEQATVNVTVNTLNLDPDVVVTPPGCPGGNNASIDLALPPGTPPVTYQWEDNSTANRRDNLSAGTYSVTLTDPSTCTQVFSFEVNDPAPLIATIDNVTDVFCNGGSTGEIFVTTTGGTPPYTFVWNDPNAQNEEDAGALTAGDWTLTVTDSRNCSTTVTATVNEPAPLALAFESFPVACRGGSDGRAVARPTGGNGGYTYSWDTGSTTDSVSNLAAGVFNVTVTDALGCQASNSVRIEQPDAALVATAAQTGRGCFGTASNQATVNATGGAGSYTYRWSSGETTATATALPGGENFVTVTDSFGCALTVPLLIEELPEVTVSTLATAPSCNNTNDGQLGAVPAGGIGNSERDYTYAWSNGMTGIVIVNLPGNVLYRVTATDRQGCTGVGERFLPRPAPITFATEETPVDCAGNATGGLRVTDIQGPNRGDFALQWGPEARSATEATVQNLPAGTYSLRIRDNAGCRLDTSLQITEPAPLALITEKEDIACFGERNGRIQVTGTGGVAPYRFFWENGSTQARRTGLPAGEYAVTITDANDCMTSETITIIQPPAIQLAVTESTAVICAGQATGSLTVQGAGGRPPFTYSINNGSYSRNNVFPGLAAGDYLVRVRDESGCEVSIRAAVADGPEFSVDLGGPQNIIFGDSLLLNASIIGGIDTIAYRWRGSYSGTLSCDDCPQPLASPEFEIDYTLEITDGNGCRVSDRFRVSVRKIREVAVPTAFSPNGDGQNDRLLVHGRPGTRVRNFAVFDRWSNLLFEASDFPVNDTDRGWDGTHRGEAVSAGVYLYKMTIEYDDGSSQTLAGETTLIR